MSKSWERLRAVGSNLRSKAPDTRMLCVVLCAAPSRLATVTRVMLRMGSVRPPSEPAPRLPIPHILAVIALEQGFDLEVMGLPLDPRSRPMWPVALVRANVAVALDAAPDLEAVCELAGTLLLDAKNIAPTFSEDDEEEIAALLHAAAQRAVS
jgi:hypothetical protein